MKCKKWRNTSDRVGIRTSSTGLKNSQKLNSRYDHKWWYFSIFIGSHSLFIRNCYRENCFAHPSALRLRCLLFSAPLRANTTLSVNNWPILYVSISAGDVAKKGCTWAREVCNSCVHHRALCPASTNAIPTCATRLLFVVLFLSPRISSSKFIHTWDTCDERLRHKFFANELSE